MLINYKINFKQNWHFTEYVCYFEILNVDKTRKIYPYLSVTGNDLYWLKQGKRDHLFFKLKCSLQFFGKHIR